MPVRPAFRPADWIERHRNPQAVSNCAWLVIAVPLYPNRAKRVTGMAPPLLPPLLRFSVLIRCLRDLLRDFSVPHCLCVS
jgi:hypothetical protein